MQVKNESKYKEESTMKILIDNCFHWIHFYIVQKYLEEGHIVYGVDSIMDSKEEFLYEMIGRNSNFILLDSLKEVKKEGLKEDTIFITNEVSKKVNIPCSHFFLLEERDASEERDVQQDNHFYIYLPAVIGPWMERKKFQKRKNSKAEPLFIEDVVNWFYHFVTSLNKRNIIIMKAKGEAIHKDHISLLRQFSHEKAIQIVEEHLLRFHYFYSDEK